MPASSMARAVASGRQYMSQKRATPPRIISAQASRAPPAHHPGAAARPAPEDVLGPDLAPDGPDLLLEPAHQRRVAAVTAEERHRRVGVAVDEGGDERLPRRLDRLVSGPGRHLRPDG